MPNTQNNRPFLGNALIGACLAVFTSVPLSAYFASFLGDSYTTRVLIYGVTLLWVISGAITIFFKTYKSEGSKISIRFIFLWFLSGFISPSKRNGEVKTSPSLFLIGVTY